MKVTEEFSSKYVQPILDDWDIPSGIGSGTGSVGAPIGGGYYEPSAPAYDTYQAPAVGGKPPGALEDGLGHWWNEATQQWENDSGGAYQAPAAVQQPTEYLGNSVNSGVYQQGGNTWENGNWWNANDEVWSNELNNWFKPQDLNQAWQDIAQHDNSFAAPDVTLPSNVLRDLAQHDNSFPAPDTMLPSQPWLQEHENAIPYPDWSGQAGTAWLNEFRQPKQMADPNKPWWEMDGSEIRAPGDLRQPDPFNVGYKADARFPKGGTIGDPLDYLLNTFGRPVAETAFQGLSPWRAGIDALPGGKGDVGDIFSGWKDLGNTVSQSGFNPNEFMDIQREKYAERPWYQQLAGDAIFDPLNLAGAGAAKKLGLIDDAADLFKGVDRGVELADAARRGQKGARVIPGLLDEMPQFAPDIERGWQAADELAMGVNKGKAIPQIRGVADDAFRAVDPEELAFGGARDTAESTGMRSVDNVAESPRAAYAKVSDQAARVEADAVRLAREGNEEGAKNAWNVLDNLNERLHQLGNVLAGEAGSTPVELAARIGGQTALGAGVGAAYGEASGGDWKKGALVGAGIGAGTVVGFKAAEKVASKGVAAQLQENLYPRPLAAQKLVAILKEAKPIRGAQEALYSAERSRRAGMYLGSLGSGSGAEARLAAAKGALGGELPRTKAFEEVRSSLNANDIDELFSHIEDTPLRGAGKNDAFTKTKATDALVKTLMGELPTHSDIKLLGQIFGEDFEKALLSKRSLGAKAWENMMEVAELPRTLLTSMDMSAPLRQGLIPGLVHPFEATKSFGKMLRAMASEEYSKLLEEGIRTSPNADAYEKMGMEFTSTGATLAHREETIASSLAGHIPLVGGSQRGYTTFMNQLRKGIADNFIASNPNLSDKEMKSFGRLINITSGRGVIPKSWEDKTALLTPFFAPKYAISRFQLPVEMLKALKAGVPGASDAASREAAKQLYGFIGAGTAVLYLGKQSGLWDVELDPRSSDFGKGKIGPQRFDVWAGEQQLVRTAAQLITRQGKAQTGNIYDKPRRDTLENWFRSKLGPPAALGYDLAKGEDFIGNPVDFSTKEAIGNQAWTRLAPIFLQDMADAARVTGNPWMALSAAPAGLGIGVSTYEDSDSKKRQDWIKANADLLNDPNLVQEGKSPDSWDNLSPTGKQLVNEQYGKIESTSAESIKAKAVLDAKIAEQGEDDAKLGTSMTPEQWWNAYADRKHDLFVAKDTIYSDLQASGKFGTDPILTPYFDAIEKSKTGNGGRPDWDEVDKYTATLTPAQRDYIKTNTGLIKIDTPQVRAMEKIHDDIEASGYFERVDENWAKVSKTLGITGYDSYYDWRNAEIDRLLGKYGYDRSDVNTVAEINKYLDKQEPAKGMDYYRKQWNDKWVMENPEAAYHAWQLGFYNPIADIKKWLAAKFEKPND